MKRRRRLSYNGTLPYCHLSNKIMVTLLLRPRFVAQKNYNTVSYEKPSLMWSPVSCNTANGHLLKSFLKPFKIAVESSIL